MMSLLKPACEKQAIPGNTQVTDIFCLDDKLFADLKTANR